MTRSRLTPRRWAGTVATCSFLATLAWNTPTVAAESLIASDRPSYLRDAGIEPRLGETLPLDLSFVDDRGRPVQLGDYFGERPVILAPVYYRCPMLCGLVLEGLAKSLKVLTFGADQEYELVAYSFNPAETPADASERKARALDLYDRAGAETGWHFLTGEEPSIARLNEAIGFRAAFDEGRGEYIHAATIVLLTPDGTITRYFYGVEYPPKNLRLGLVEASNREIGTPLDQVLLYCYRYNPATGQYTLLTMRLLKIGATLTILGLATLITVLLRLEKRSTSSSEGLA